MPNPEFRLRNSTVRIPHSPFPKMFRRWWPPSKARSMLFEVENLEIVYIERTIVSYLAANPHVTGRLRAFMGWYCRRFARPW